MPVRQSDEKRKAVAEAIKAGGKRNEIAREHGVSAGFVTQIAKEARLTDAFDRSQTEMCTRARMADMAELRSQTMARLLRIANEQLDRVDQPCEVYAFGGMDGRFKSHVMDKPPSAEVRNFMTAAAIAIDKHALLDRHDADRGHDDTKSMLAGISEGLRAYQRAKDQAE